MAKASAFARSTAPVEGKESFAALLEESLQSRDSFEGTVVQGTVVGIDNDFAMIDVGLKSEGRVSLKEFAGPTGQTTLKVGDRVEVFIERLEDKNGEAMLSREKAKREESWVALDQAFQKQERVTFAQAERLVQSVQAVGSIRITRRPVADQQQRPVLCQRLPS